MAEPPLRVLLVEDNPGDARLVEERLKEAAPAEFEVVRTDRIAAATARLAAPGIDVVLLDVGLPDVPDDASRRLDGLRRIREVSGRVPVVLVTGGGDEALGERAVGSGAQDYLSKRELTGPALVRTLRYAVLRARVEELSIEAVASRRELAMAKDLDRFRIQFMNAAAHELATPLTSILLELALLRKKSGDGTSLTVLTRNVERLHRLVRDLLEATRIQAGKLPLELSDVDVSQVVRLSVESLREQATRAGISLSASGADGPVFARGDPVRLGQVVDILGTNAIKFTPKGGRITMRVEPHADDVRVAVEDTGIGLSPEQAARLFQAFTQVHDAVQTGVQGAGLGLFIARSIVELHGGRIFTESGGPGKGATFTFVIPLRARGDKRKGDEGR
ncbi:MAG: ATP-binding response regulator [Methanobacteriota archaeon]